MHIFSFFIFLLKISQLADADFYWTNTKKKHLLMFNTCIYEENLIVTH